MALNVSQQVSRPVWRIALIVALAAGALVACGTTARSGQAPTSPASAAASASSAPTGQPVLNACGLLTQMEVEAAGAPYQPHGRTDAGGSLCIWNATGGDVDDGSVGMALIVTCDPSTVDSNWAKAQKQASPLAGGPQGALIAPTDKAGTILFSRHGKCLLVLQGAGIGKEQLVTVLNTVDSRM